MKKKKKKNAIVNLTTPHNKLPPYNYRHTRGIDRLKSVTLYAPTPKISTVVVEPRRYAPDEGNIILSNRRRSFHSYIITHTVVLPTNQLDPSEMETKLKIVRCTVVVVLNACRGFGPLPKHQ